MKKLNKFKADLDKLFETGSKLVISMEYETATDQENYLKDNEITKNDILNFKIYYQAWYTESLILIKQITPDRSDDFKAYYEIPKNRERLNHGNYKISDYLHDTVRNYRGKRAVNVTSALPSMIQQTAIVYGLQQRFESSLFDIINLTQADLMDNEIEAAIELNKKGFVRGAGAVAGVVLESHLRNVCDQIGIPLKKSEQTINGFNQALKSNNTIELSQFRFIQHLGDIRNKCDHKKETDPSQDEVSELISGVDKIIKTVF